MTASRRITSSGVGERGDVQDRHLGALGLLQVADDQAGRDLGGRQAGEVGIGEGALEPACGVLARPDRRHRPPRDQRLRHRPVDRDDHLGRVQPLQLGGGLVQVELGGLELAGRHVRPGQPQPVVERRDGDQVGRAVLAQQARIGHRARRERPDDVALADAAASRGSRLRRPAGSSSLSSQTATR